MNAIRLLLTSAALCAGVLAGCDKPAEKSAVTAPAAAALPTPQISSTATTSKDNLAPIQGQVDTKEPAQRRDFETKR